MQLELLFLLLSICLVVQGYSILNYLYPYHEELNNAIRGLITKSFTGVEHHMNSTKLGFSTKIVGAKANEIWELDGNFLEHGVTSKSIEVVNFTLLSVMQYNLGWIAFYRRTSMASAPYYKFVTYDDTITLVATYDLTILPGQLRVQPATMFSFDGTNVYFYGNYSCMSYINVSTSVTTNIPYGNFMYHGTVRYDYFGNIIFGNSHTYFFDELVVSSTTNALGGTSNGIGLSTWNACQFFFDGDYFYFGNMYYGSTNLISKKTL